MSLDVTGEIQTALEDFAEELKIKLGGASTHLAWPEDQLKSPLDTLLKRVGAALKTSVVVRTEAPRPSNAEEGAGGRVDAAVSAGPTQSTTVLTGHVELKAPGKGGDPSKLRKQHDKQQWQKFKKLPNLIYTDGRQWSLQRTGVRSGALVTLDGDPLKDGRAAVSAKNAASFERLIRSFLMWEPIVPKSSKQIAELLAPLCRLLRTEAKAALDDADSALSSLAKEWRKYLFPSASDEVVADAYAQTFTYALLIARFEGANPLTVEKAEEVLSKSHGLLGEVLGLLSNPAAHAEVKTSTDMILRVVAQIKPNAITKRDSANPWLYFYEDFLEAYDPKLRKKVGAYYTPPEVVRAQTQMVGTLLKEKFGKHRGFADDGVVVLDPAVGTGTYPLGILESVAADVPANAPGSAPGRLRQAAKNLHGIEYLIGPYAVAHLRLSRFLDDHKVKAPEGEELLNILLADTLASHEADVNAMLPEVFGYENIMQEREEARELKVDTRVVVCMGNPPYLRGKKTDVERGGSTGGWVTMRREPVKGAKVLDPQTRRRVRDKGEVGIISDFIQPAIDAGKGNDLKNLYNAYVYFWRWALWKVFEQDIPMPGAGDPAQMFDKNGIVSFITASSFLRGPGFVGMRQHMRSLFDEVWIVDLGGDNKGGRRTENVFSIETPVAITTGVRYGAANPNVPATVHYANLSDLSAKEKKSVLNSIQSLSDDQLNWRTCMSGWQDPLLPADNAEYLSWPALTDLFPWQTGGPQVKRTWPIGETKNVLQDRWKALVAPLDAGELTESGHTNSRKLSERRAIQLKESRDRKVASDYPDLFSDKRLPALSKLMPTSEVPKIVSYAYRSFDRQWILADNRLGDFMRPSLWAAHSDKQVYMTSMLTGVLGEGPAAVATEAVPDLDHFRGSFGGRHVIPLWKDADASIPNITPGLLDELTEQLGLDVTAPDFFAYCYGLLASPDYVRKFWDELTIPGPHIPVTSDSKVFADVRDHGRKLLNLHTFGKRFNEEGKGDSSITSTTAVFRTAIPADQYPEKFKYDADKQTLTIGAGLFENIAPEVWDYSVSGMKVLSSWIGYRLKKRAGRSGGSPLDSIRPASWPDPEGEVMLELLGIIEQTVALEREGKKLLDRVLDSQLLYASALPQPDESDRQALSAVDDDEDLMEDLDESNDEPELV